MGDVIQGSFGKSKPRQLDPVQKPVLAPTKVQRDPATENEELRRIIAEMGPEGARLAMIDLLFITTNDEYVHDIRDKLQAINDYIEGRADFVPSPEVINTHRAQMRELTFEEICRLVEKSDRTQWSRHPSYFAALILMYDARFMYAISVLPEK